MHDGITRTPSSSYESPSSSLWIRWFIRIYMSYWACTVNKIDFNPFT